MVNLVIYYIHLNFLNYFLVLGNNLYRINWIYLQSKAYNLFHLIGHYFNYLKDFFHLNLIYSSLSKAHLFQHYYYYLYLFFFRLLSSLFVFVIISKLLFIIILLLSILLLMLFSLLFGIFLLLLLLILSFMGVVEVLVFLDIIENNTF